MKKIILDQTTPWVCNGKDVDDGRPLVPFRKDDVNLLGLTTTFGNSTIDEVYNNTLNMFNELGITHIPLKKGAPSPHSRHSEAAEFLVEAVNKYPG